jgi:hypothetical protein
MVFFETQFTIYSKKKSSLLKVKVNQCIRISLLLHYSQVLRKSEYVILDWSPTLGSCGGAILALLANNIWH